MVFVGTLPPVVSVINLEYKMTHNTYDKFLSEFPNMASEVHSLDTYNLRGRVVSWTKSKILHFYNDERVKALENGAEPLPIGEKVSILNNIESVILLAHPNYDPDQHGYIVMWPNEKARLKGKAGRISIRAGRGFRKMFPDLSDAQIEILVDEYRKDFSVVSYKIHESKEPEDFAHAYSHIQSKMDNPAITADRKSLAYSCMRYKFDHLSNHPAYVYGSGDFTIFFATDEDDKISGRCVVRTDLETWQAGPIYGVSEVAMDKIQECIKAKNPSCEFRSSYADWEGARLLRIVTRHGYIMPYLDIEPREVSVFDDEHMIIKEGGDCRADFTAGRTTERSRFSCSCCDEDLDDDTMHVDPNNGDRYCEECFDDRFSYCSCCDEYHDSDDMGIVYTIRRSRFHNEELWCSHCISVNAVETVSGDIYSDRDVTEIHNGDYVDNLTLSSDYFQSAWSNEYYHNDTLCETVDGDFVSSLEISGDEYKQNSDGLYYKVESNEEEESNV